MRRGRGFTLLEVLVALAIFAVVAASVLSASARSLKTAARLEDKTFATWLADNRLQEIQLADAPPVEGREQGEESYAGRRWQWQTEVQATSEPEMLRITVRVAPRPERGLRGKIEDNALVTLSGFVGAYNQTILRARFTGLTHKAFKAAFTEIHFACQPGIAQAIHHQIHPQRKDNDLPRRAAQHFSGVYRMSAFCDSE